MNFLIKYSCLFFLLFVFQNSSAQIINVNNVTRSGLFSTCSNSNPTVTINYVSGTGTSVVGGSLVCNDPCGTTTLHVVISNIKWEQQNAEWLHGIFFPVNAGYTVTGIAIPAGFITYNGGCTGLCPVGITAGPGFYFDNSSGNTCCGPISANDGMPCNNYGDPTLDCGSTFSLNFNLTFCNSTLTTASETFTLKGTSDGGTGCYSVNNFASHTISFTINTLPCNAIYNTAPSASVPTRNCVGNNISYTSVLTGGCGSGSTISWYNAPVGGSIVGQGSPFNYTPSNGACPSGTTLYSSCCPLGSTTCVSRTSVLIPGSCNVLSLINITKTTNTCTTPGSITSINLSNAQGLVNYVLNPGNISNNTGQFSNLTLPSYTVIATDAGNCSVSSIVNFNTLPVIGLSISSIINPTCALPNGGSCIVTGSGGVAPYTYLISPSATQSAAGVFSGMSNQIYTITASDVNNCTSTSTIQITTPNGPVFSTPIKTNISCFGGNNGSITQTATGGTGVINYNLQPTNQTNATGVFNNLVANTYSVKATDANGCSVTTQILISQPSQLVFNNPTQINVSCFGGNNGSITQTATGGTGVINYNLQPTNQTNATGIFSNLVANSYTVKATDANGCSITTQIIISQPSQLVFNLPTKINVSCFGGSNGQITQTATGGTGVINYNLQPTNQTNATGIFSNLVANTYTVKATDANGCSITTQIQITVPTQLQWNVPTKINVSCFGGNNSSITQIATGGTGVINYNLQPTNQTNATGIFTNLVANTYTVKATDANGCSITTQIVISQPSQLVFNNPTQINVSCFGGNNGSITQTATGGTGVINYNLQPTNQTNATGIFTNLVANTYTVKATDANGCSITTQIVISQPSQLVFNLPTKINVNCFGGNNGSITHTATGGTGVINYNLQPSNQTNGTGIFNNLVANNYTITATDANGCSITTQIQITEPTQLQITNIGNTVPSCVPGNDGSITITATGGTPTYQYNNGGVNQNSNIINNVGAGTYTVTVTDSKGCAVTSSIQIITPNGPVFSTPTIIPISCFGGNNASITQIATGGTGVINYNLQPINQTNSTGIFTNLVANTYTVKATDANGCSVTTQILISQPSQLGFNNPTQINVSCFGGNNGSITQTATGGTGVINYNLQPTNQTNATGIFTNLVANTYTVKATDANGCSITTQIVISQPSQLVFNLPTKINVNCFGGNNGSITQTATGGTGVINYNLQPTNQTNGTGIFNNLVANNYTITATDANGCSITTQIQITEPTQLQITNIGNTLPSCVPGNDGSITITATGGTPTYQYNNGGVNQNSNIINNVGAGSYAVTVTDSKGCTVTSSIQIITPNGPVFSTPTIIPISCFGGNNASITQIATGGTGVINYNLQPTNQTNATGIFTSLVANTYTVKATDANGCSITTQIVISQPSQLVFNNPTQINVSCFGGNNGSITQTATGGTGVINYNLQPTNQTNATGIFTSLVANSYTVKATDANGCSITTQIVISQPSQLVFNLSTKINVNCFGGNNGSITQTATGGTGIISYNIQPSNQTNGTGIFNNLVANTYTIMATDANGCSITTQIQITEPTQLQITNIGNTVPSCVPGNDGSITITATGGTPTYQYNNGGVNQNPNIINNVGAGSYTVTVTDSKGCTVTSSIQIITPNGPVFSTPTIIPISCFGGNNSSITQIATGGTGVINYNLQPTNQTNATGIFTSLVANSYTVKATDANGCSITTQIVISQPSQLVFNNPTQINVSCFGGNNGSITQTATGGTGVINYNLQPTNQTNATGIFTNLVANSYTVTATDVNNCSITTTITITEPTPLQWNVPTKINVNCFGGNNGSITQTATGGIGVINYNLQPTNQTNGTGIFNNLVANNYTITATDSNNCIITTQLNITEPTQLQITNIGNTLPSCVPGNDGSITITATGGTPTYQYNNGGVNQNSNIINNVGAGSYAVTVTDSKGCTVTSSIQIITPNGPVFSTPTIIPISCFGGNNGSITQIATGGTGVINYNLQPTNQTNATGIFTNLVANTYTVKATDANGCSITTQIVISQPSQLVFNNPTQINVSCFGGNNGSITQTATGGTGVINYNLQPTNQTNATGIFSNLVANSYTVTATDVNNCSITTTITITEPTPLQWNVPTKINVNCFGGNNGSITQTATGGIGVINYNLQPTNQTNGTGIFNNLVANNYTITATDSNNCIITTQLNITEPTQLQITNIGNTLPSCVPGNDGSITITATGGTPTYQYNNGGVNQNPNIINNVGAGSYTVTVTDSKGCTVTSSIQIITPNGPNIISIATTNASCIPGNDGTATITVSNGLLPYTYSSDGLIFQNSNVLLGLSNSFYTVVAKDANGCTNTSVIQIINPQVPSINSVNTTTTTCNLSCDGTATIAASSQNSTISSYSIDGINFQNSNLFSGLCPTNYTIVVKDANGCTSTSIISINQGSVPNIANLLITNVLCNGGSTGAIQTQITGGIGVINYNLLPSNITNQTGVFSNLQASNYTITVSDINGCSSVSSTSILEPALLQFTNVTFSGTNCNGSSGGIINAPTSGGTGNIIYSINPLANFVAPSNFNNLTGNVTYTITATDVNNCSTSTTIFITQPNSITINNFVVNNISCNNLNDGKLTVVASGGTGLLSYSISPNNQNNNSGVFTALNAGNYIATITDANNCSITSAFSIVNPPAIVLSSLSSSNVICNNQTNGVISISCSGGLGNLSYNLQPTNVTNSTGTFNNLSANIYSIITTDANGCTYSTIINIANPTPLIFDSIVTSNISCAGNSNGTIAAFASGSNGSYTFSIQPNVSSNSTGYFNNLNATIYTITVTDILGCSNVSTKQIIEPLPINFILDSIKNNKCFGESLGAIYCHASNGTPNYWFKLLPNNTVDSFGNFSNLSSNSYTIITTDINGCSTSSNPITISQPTQLKIDSIISKDVLCFGTNTGEIKIVVTGGTGVINYSLSTNPTIFSPIGLFTNLYAGNYFISAKDANNCIISTSLILNQNPAIEFTEIIVKNPSCHGDANGSIYIKAIGGYGILKYQLNNGPSLIAGNYQGLTAGNYLISIRDDNNCIKDTIISIIEPAPVYFSSLEIFSVNCFGASDGSVKVTASGGTGNYTYYIRPGLHINQNGFFYNLHEGIYTLTVIDENQCNFDTTFTITPSLNPLKTAMTKQDLGCYGKGVEGWADANVSGGEPPYTFVWSTKPAQTTEKVENLMYGYYFVDIVDANGCNIKDTVYIDPGTCCEEVFIPNAFTPNGDGINDEFKVTTSTGIELIQFAIFDRWGNRIWNTYDFRRGWDGSYKGAQESMNTFHYIFHYKCLTDGNTYMRKGDVNLIR